MRVSIYYARHKETKQKRFANPQLHKRLILFQKKKKIKKKQNQILWIDLNVVWNVPFHTFWISEIYFVCRKNEKLKIIIIYWYSSWISLDLCLPFFLYKIKMRFKSRNRRKKSQMPTDWCEISKAIMDLKCFELK